MSVICCGTSEPATRSMCFGKSGNLLVRTSYRPGLSWSLRMRSRSFLILPKWKLAGLNGVHTRRWSSGFFGLVLRRASRRLRKTSKQTRTSCSSHASYMISRSSGGASFDSFSSCMKSERSMPSLACCVRVAQSPMTSGLAAGAGGVDMAWRRPSKVVAARDILFCVDDAAAAIVRCGLGVISFSSCSGAGAQEAAGCGASG